MSGLQPGNEQRKRCSDRKRCCGIERRLDGSCGCTRGYTDFVASMSAKRIVRGQFFRDLLRQTGPHAPTLINLCEFVQFETRILF